MIKKNTGLPQIHMAVFLFGMAALFGKFLDLSPLMIVLGRTFFGAFTLGVMILIKNISFKIGSWKSILSFLVQGAVLALHWLTFFHAIQISTVALALLTFSTFPVFVTFMEPFFFNEKLHTSKVFMSILVFAGLILVIPPSDPGNNLARGCFWGVISGFTFAILAIINRKMVVNYPPVKVAFYQNGFAMLLLIPLSVPALTMPEPSALILIMVLGVFCTAFAHTLFIKSLITIKAQTASIISALEPVYGIIFAFLLLGERPSLRMITGGIIIILVTMASPFFSRQGNSL